MTNKREKVLKGKQSNKFLPIMAIGAILVVGVAVGMLFGGKEQSGADAPNVGQANVGAPTAQTGKNIALTMVTPKIADGKVRIKLADVKQSGLVQFELPNQPITLPTGAQFDSLPVIAYVAPSGRLVGAVSFCEPCSGTKFHIEGDALVCDSCGTRWTLEDLEGISGGCLTYPPDEVEYQLQNDIVEFDEATLRAWTPRPL